MGHEYGLETEDVGSGRWLKNKGVRLRSLGVWVVLVVNVTKARTLRWFQWRVSRWLVQSHS